MPRRPCGFIVLGLFMGMRTYGAAREVLAAGPAGDAVEALARATHILSVSAAAMLVVGLFTFAPWVARAATWWFAAVVARNAVEMFTVVPELDEALLGLVALSVIPGLVLLYVRERAPNLPSVHAARIQAALAAGPHAP